MSALPTVNLLPKTLLARRARVTLLRGWVAVLCLAVVVVMIGAFVVRAPSVLKEESLGRASASVNAKINALQSELPGLNERLGVLDRRLLMLDTLEDRPDWGVLLAYLYEQRGEGVTLERCALSWSPEGVLTFSLTGLGDSPGRERSLVTGLESSGLFSSTTLLGTRREMTAGAERIVFEIACEFDPAVAEAPTP